MATYVLPLVCNLGTSNTGLEATLAYTIYDNDGVVLVATATGDATESPAGSGMYQVAGGAEIDTEKSGYVIWEDPSGVYAIEGFVAYATITEAGGVSGSGYTSYAEIKNLIPDIDNMVIPAGTDVEDWVAYCIGYAEDEINGRLEHLYATPFDPVPSLIKAIARYFAVSKILEPNFVGEIPAESRWSDTNRRNGNALLEKLESGEIRLWTATAATSSPDLPQSTSSDRARDMTQGFYDSEGTMISDAAGTLDDI